MRSRKKYQDLFRYRLVNISSDNLLYIFQIFLIKVCGNIARAYEVKQAMKYPPLTQLNGVFGVIKPCGITAAKTCNRIRDDLIKGMELEVY